jgi:hypothetical protein
MPSIARARFAYLKSVYSVALPSGSTRTAAFELARPVR